jgi:hypothetical protein
MNDIDTVIDFLQGLAYINKGNMGDNLKELSDALKRAHKIAEMAMDAKSYMNEILEYNGTHFAIEGQLQLNNDLEKVVERELKTA